MSREQRAVRPGWRRVRLGDFCDIQLGKMLSPASKTGSNSFPYLRNANIQWNRVEVADLAIMDFSEEERAKFALRKGDLLVCEGGEPGRSAVWEEPFVPCYYQKALHRLRPLADAADPYFLMYRLWHGALTGEFIDLNNKSTIAHLPVIRLQQITVALPPLPEQQAIVHQLEREMAEVERLQAACERQSDAIAELRAAHLRDVFEGEEVQQWRVARLGTIGVIGSGVTLGKLYEDEMTRLVPYLRVANVKDGYLDLSSVNEISVPEQDIERCRLQRGDLLLTEGGDPDKLGRGTFWQDELPECIHQNHIFRVRFDTDHHLPSFLSMQIGSSYGKRYFLSHAKQTTGIATINQQVLANFPLMVPNLDVQKDVAHRLEMRMEEVARLQRQAERQRAAIEALPGALLGEVFGEVTS